jgi:LuxR family maltose regulon positive regulatory protein
LVEDRIATTDVPVVLVSAPAGYGKTTLLALWRARDERPFVWVSLEAADNDPVALIRSVVSALDPVLDLDGAVAEAFAAPQPALEDFVLPAVVDACAAAAGGLVLVLDDVHAVTDARSLAAVGYLGSGCLWVVSSRSRPGSSPRCRWRAGARTAG